METLLVHADVAAAFLPALAARWRGRCGDPGLPRDTEHGPGGTPATEEDLDTEFLALTLHPRGGGPLEEAVDQIARTVPAGRRDRDRRPRTRHALPAEVDAAPSL